MYATAVGYQGGLTPNATYREVCTGRTGHAEVVRVVYDPKRVPIETLLRVFWESHDPTQGMRQGNDVGTQYRSAIYVHSPAQRRAAEASRDAYAAALRERAATARSRPRSETPRPSTTPRSITSSIWRRTPLATVGSAGPACRARSARASRRAEPCATSGREPLAHQDVRNALVLEDAPSRTKPRCS